MLSRLKGMETKLYRLTAPGIPTVFGYAFPLEGNGNACHIRSQSNCLNRSLDMLSRWKGMETDIDISSFGSTHKTLDMLSRWKGMETLRLHCMWWRCRFSLDMLSRWKGMETQSGCRVQHTTTSNFGYAFPLEGNGNSSKSAILSHTAILLWICFPVGREWKP